MNERIRKLLNEATSGLEPDISPQRTVTLNEMEKFAELIIRECCDILHRKTDESIRVVMAIEQHFGVEE